jgi:DNA-binding response OmpR family regulator
MISGGPRVQSSILIVCSEPTTSRIWGLLLTDLQCRPIIAKNLDEAIQVINSASPDVIVVDVMGREASGPEMCRQLRETASAPILLLTPVNNEGHTLEAYEAGCDECVIKPISPALFLAKVKVWLHRGWTVQAEILDPLRIGNLVLNPGKHQLEDRTGRQIRLSNLEFRVLYLLMNHPDQPLTSEEIVDRVWGSFGGGNPVLVKNVIYRLRKKVEHDPEVARYIRTVTGGYLFKQ